MPTSDFRCESCGTVFEMFRHKKEDPAPWCPTCSSQKVKEVKFMRMPSFRVEQPYFHSAFGKVVKNKHHLEELRREHQTAGEHEALAVDHAVAANRRRARRQEAC